MRTHAYFICLTLSFLFTFSNCEKDQLEQGSIETNAQIGQDRGGDTGSCDNIPPQTNFISILFRRPDGSVAPVMCFTEQEIVQTLKEGGKPSEETGALLYQLFYKAASATPARAFQLGQWMADFYGYPNGSFNIDVMGRADYPALPTATAGVKPGIAPGFIDFYTIRQAQAAPNEGLILQSGFSGLRFQNKCTGQLVTFNFPPTLDGFKRTFADAGFSEKETALLVDNITNGRYSIRQIWNLFQLALAPQLPIVQTLLAKPDADCWRLRQVGIGLYNGEGTKTSFYYAQGDGALGF